MVTHYCNRSKQNVNFRRAKKCGAYDQNKTNGPKSCNNCLNGHKLDRNPYDVQEDV